MCYPFWRIYEMHPGLSLKYGCDTSLLLQLVWEPENQRVFEELEFLSYSKLNKKRILATLIPFDFVAPKLVPSVTGSSLPHSSLFYEEKDETNFIGMKLCLHCFLNILYFPNKTLYRETVSTKILFLLCLCVILKLPPNGLMSHDMRPLR
jgi:hypothetical protein